MKIKDVIVIVVFLSCAFWLGFFARERTKLQKQISKNSYEIKELQKIFDSSVNEINGRLEKLVDASRDGSVIELIPVVVTAYNPVEKQTDKTPMITASNKKAKEGMIALSRDLEKKYDFKFGDEVYLLDLGRFIFEDRMNRKWQNRVDILMLSKKKAREFGLRSSFLVVSK